MAFIRLILIFFSSPENYFTKSLNLDVLFNIIALTINISCIIIYICSILYT